jgi:hypothetical protein
MKMLNVTIFGVVECENMLLAGMNAVGNMKPALETVADDMMAIIDINFGSQGHRGGGSWKHLNPETILRKARIGELPLILIATSALRDSMTIRGDPNMDLRITRDEVRLSSRLVYANVQDKGGGPSDLPARPFATFLDNDVRTWTRICEEYLISAMRAGHRA